jgi:hypothetical protein
VASPSVAKKPHQAYERYAEALKGVLTCIAADAHFVSNVHAKPEVPLQFAFTHNPARLNRSPYGLFLIQKIKVIPDDKQEGCWRVKTLAYEYNIERWDDHQEIVCFHWEGAESANPNPHIHIGFAATDESLPIGPKHHIPSGRVAIEDVVRFAIEEVGVQPVKGTWHSIVESAKGLFAKHKNW